MALEAAQNAGQEPLIPWTAPWYVARMEADLPEVWPGARPWADHWGSCGAYPDEKGLGAAIDRIRVPPEHLAAFWGSILPAYPEPPRISVGPLETPGLRAWLEAHRYSAAERRPVVVLPRERLDGGALGGTPNARLADSLEDLDQVLALDGLVFDDPPLTAEQRQAEWERISTGPRRLVLVRGEQGVALAAGGITRRTGWALLWGGETHPAFRRRGLYRAVLARRLELARGWDADFVAVVATPETSEPILRRWGFAQVAECTVYRHRGSP